MNEDKETWGYLSYDKQLVTTWLLPTSPTTTMQLKAFHRSTSPSEGDPSDRSSPPLPKPSVCIPMQAAKMHLGSKLYSPKKVVRAVKARAAPSSARGHLSYEPGDCYYVIEKAAGYVRAVGAKARFLTTLWLTNNIQLPIIPRVGSINAHPRLGAYCRFRRAIQRSTSTDHQCWRERHQRPECSVPSSSRPP